MIQTTGTNTNTDVEAGGLQAQAVLPVRQQVALITGITGQDGSYLTELLLEKGYEVHGIIRRSSSFNTGRLEHLYTDPHTRSKMHLHYGDLTDSSSWVHLLAKIRPAEVYNLGAQSHVKVSFELAEYTGEVDALGIPNLESQCSKSGRNAEAAGGDQDVRVREADQVLPGIDLGALRKGGRDAPKGDDAVLPALALRRCQALLLLDRGQLQGGLRHVRMQRHPLQSRVAAAGPDVCDPQDLKGRCRHPPGPVRLSVSREP